MFETGINRELERERWMCRPSWDVVEDELVSAVTSSFVVNIHTSEEV
jgi:hypothetical protein